MSDEDRLEACVTAVADEGQTGSGLKIARLEKGDKERTARHAAVMNEIIDAANAWFNAKVVPQSAGAKFVFSDSNVVLDLSDLQGFPDPPTPGTYVLGAIDGAVQWIATQSCDCGIIDGGDA